MSSHRVPGICPIRLLRDAGLRRRFLSAAPPPGWRSRSGTAPDPRQPRHLTDVSGSSYTTSGVAPHYSKTYLIFFSLFDKELMFADVT